MSLILEGLQLREWDSLAECHCQCGLRKTFHFVSLILSNRGKQISSPFRPLIEKSMPRIFKQQLKKQITFVPLIYHFCNSIIGLFQLGHCIIMKHVREILKLNEYKEIKLPNLLIWTITTAHPIPPFWYISEPLKKLITFSSIFPIAEVRLECVSNEWLTSLTLYQPRQKLPLVVMRLSLTFLAKGI